MKKFFLAMVILTAPMSANAQDRAPDYSYDGPSRIKEILVSKPLANERVLSRTPIFDNVPFLNLKPGDQLV